MEKKNNKLLFSIISLSVLLIGVVGVTFAFFNYTRTGGENLLQVGRISFVSRQTRTINIPNIFPIEAATANLEDSTKVGIFELEIEGDTDYSNGIV